MSQFLISLWVNGKEEHVHPCGHFLWFLSHDLFGLFMFSLVNLVCTGFILFYEMSQPCPFLPLVCCLFLKRNNLFLGTVTAPGLALHPLQGHLFLSWPWGIHCLCSCGPWTIHVVIPAPNSIVMTSQASLWDVFMERFEPVGFMNQLSAFSSSSTFISDPLSPKSPQQNLCNDVE